MTTNRPDDQLAIVLGQRQLIAVCCMFLVVIGLVATLAYVSGRTISAAQMSEAQRTSTNALVVEPAGTVPAAMHAQAEPLPAPTPTPTPAPSAKIVVPPVGVDAPPAPGAVFWQVGVVDRGIAAVFVEYLTRLGLKARTAPAQAPGLQRVLAGPLDGQGEIEEAKRALDQAGLQSFLKKY